VECGGFVAWVFSHGGTKALRLGVCLGDGWTVWLGFCFVMSWEYE